MKPVLGCLAVLLLIAPNASAQTEIPEVPRTAIEQSLVAAGQPFEKAHALVTGKASLALLADVVRQYESLPQSLELSRGNIALHHLVARTKLPAWKRGKKGSDVRVLQDFRDAVIWGYRYGYYYPAFGKFAHARQGSGLKTGPAPHPAYCDTCQEFECHEAADVCITLAIGKVVHGKRKTGSPTVLRMTNTLYNEFQGPKNQFYNVGVLTVTGTGREFWFINRHHPKSKAYNVHVTVTGK